MAYKIVLDAGHGGEDPGAVSMERLEKDDTLALTLAVGEILTSQNQEILYTRTTDIYQTPFQKAQIANAAMADYFISFHRNSSETENQYAGVETLLYDKSGIKLTMAENINGALSEIGFKNLGIKERPGLVVLRRTAMPALLVEVGFINSTEDNQLFSKNLRTIAKAIAFAILGTLDKENVTSPVLYRVQTGSFRKKEYADRMNYELQDRGYPSFILEQNGYYKVQTGAFEQLSNAITMEKRLRKDGYQTFITSQPG